MHNHSDIPKPGPGPSWVAQNLWFLWQSFAHFLSRVVSRVSSPQTYVTTPALVTPGTWKSSKGEAAPEGAKVHSGTLRGWGGRSLGRDLEASQWQSF